MLILRVIKCFGPTEAEMWHIASSSSAAKQQPANQYVVSKPSNYKQHVLKAQTHKHTDVNSRWMQSIETMWGHCVIKFDFCYVTDAPVIVLFVFDMMVKLNIYRGGNKKSSSLLYEPMNFWKDFRPALLETPRASLWRERWWSFG